MKSIQIKDEIVFAEEIIGQKIEEELENTIAMMKELGYKVRYERKRSIQIIFEYSGKRTFIIDIFTHPKKNTILNIMLGCDIINCSDVVKKSYKKQYGANWGCSSRELNGDLVTPITFLQTQKTRLLLNK